MPPPSPSPALSSARARPPASSSGGKAGPAQGALSLTRVVLLLSVLATCVFSALQLAGRLDARLGLVALLAGSGSGSSGSGSSVEGNYLAEEAGADFVDVKRELEEELLPRVNFQLAIEETQKSLSLMYNRYECSSKLGEAFMLIQQNILESDWNLIKLRFAEKILGEGADARYLMIFGGSSVTAGHDNGVNLSYPLIVNKRMHAPLAAAGVDLQVHNIAQGANNCLPSNVCFESMGGHDPDFVGWEQSFNCGRDEKIFELTTRFAAWSKTPGSAYFSNSGSVNPNHCNISEFKKPWSDEDWTPDLEGLPAWNPTPDDVKYWRERYNFAYTKGGSTSQRFGGRSYPYRNYGVAVLGQDLWGSYKRTDLCDAAPEMNGLQCSPEVFYSKCVMKMMRKEAAAYGMGRGARHHPGKGMHQVRGELISFLYSLIFLDALYDVQAAVAAAGATSGTLSRTVAQAVRQKFSDERAAMVTMSTMPKPIMCGPYHCETKPNCFTEYRSHFSEDLFLSQQLVGPLNWESNVRNPGVADTKFSEHRGGYHSRNSSDGGLHLKIKIGETNFLMVCFYHIADAQHAMEYYLEPNVDPARLTSEYAPKLDKVINWETDVVMEPGYGCHKIHNLPAGQHVLGIRYKENAKKAAAGISHLITWN